MWVLRSRSMKRVSWLGASLLLVSSIAGAQAPGFVELSVSGLGASGNTLGVSGESRLPVRPRDETYAGGALRVRAMGVRGSVRTIDLQVRSPSAGQRFMTGDGTQMTVQFASGNSLEPGEGQGWIEFTAVDAQHAVGTFEATLVRGNVPLTLRGRFEANFSAQP